VIGQCRIVTLTLRARFARQKVLIAGGIVCDYPCESVSIPPAMTCPTALNGACLLSRRDDDTSCTDRKRNIGKHTYFD
jgi:hypothetical protein